MKHHTSDVLAMQRRREQIDDKLNRLDSTSYTSARHRVFSSPSTIRINFDDTLQDQQHSQLMKTKTTTIIPRSNVKSSRISRIASPISLSQPTKASSISSQQLSIPYSQSWPFKQQSSQLLQHRGISSPSFSLVDLQQRKFSAAPQPKQQQHQKQQSKGGNHRRTVLQRLISTPCHSKQIPSTNRRQLNSSRGSSAKSI